MANRTPIVVGEYYHCYNRGVDKRIIFLDAADYQRFLKLLYLANDASEIHLSNYHGETLQSLLAREREDPLVEIIAYSLMPNHFHLLLYEKQAGGISLFMKKVGTAYAMYFNKRYDRSGALFQGAFKSSHIDEDRYCKYALDYIEFNAAELHANEWKDRKVVLDVQALEVFLSSYKYASLLDRYTKRPESAILSDRAYDVYDFSIPLKERLMYYRDNVVDLFEQTISR